MARPFVEKSPQEMMSYAIRLRRYLDLSTKLTERSKAKAIAGVDEVFTELQKADGRKAGKK